ESDDSRDWGPVPKDSLVGRAVFRYLPLRRFGSL
ncbi:MAG: Signal peptidase peptidase, partial [Thermoleophilaceae bacterium]|nr:Signal peptidase peptidase [Thermoleophilaceae bacterium]